MNEFWCLVAFEYKKILHKRSVQITLLIAIALTAVSIVATLFGNYYIDGKPYETNYDAMIKDRNYARSLAGRVIDGNLIMESVNAYTRIPESNRYYNTQEFQTYARPYSAVYGIVRSVFNSTSSSFNFEDFRELTREQAETFYLTRHDHVEQLIESTQMSKKAKIKVLALNEHVKVPFKFSYIDGYTRFLVFIYSLGIMVTFVIAICVAPLFSGEYSSGADQLILSSKRGKNMLITAKLFTGVSLAASICLLLVALSFGLSMAVFGSDGGSSPLQLYIATSPYPVTIGQTALLMTISILFASIMVASITMFLSAKLKSSFSVIVLISVFLIAPMLGSVSETNLLFYNLYHLFPTQMTAIWSVMNSIQYEIFGMIFRPYVFIPLFAATVSGLLMPFAYRSFKNHQIS